MKRINRIWPFLCFIETLLLLCLSTVLYLQTIAPPPPGGHFDSICHS